MLLFHTSRVVSSMFLCFHTLVKWNERCWYSKMTCLMCRHKFFSFDVTMETFADVTMMEPHALSDFYRTQACAPYASRKLLFTSNLNDFHNVHICLKVERKPFHKKKINDSRWKIYERKIIFRSSLFFLMDQRSTFTTLKSIFDEF